MNYFIAGDGSKVFMKDLFPENMNNFKKEDVPLPIIVTDLPPFPVDIYICKNNPEEEKDRELIQKIIPIIEKWGTL